ncbi:hypothetical protein ORD22_02670 [Sporosarcina sp. GW1-11]|uniref:hypothetical protein n=1 Tax=Sporosarcina sp. GW1-11 TaxID=2899126 RepID=UPI00294C6875|nr:hypothetical protein [Sporosarcina sp. GW1-11]MDV6377165.1 hypothetical protein [Sporosarcina sp. GW1-11]
MSGDIIFALLPIAGVFIYLIPIVFIVWFLIKFIRIQERKNEILQSIAEKMNKND